MKNKFIIVGFGNIGKHLYKILSEKFQTIVVDSNISSEGENFLKIDVKKNRKKFENLVKNQGFVLINCLPYYLSSYVAKICLENNCNYFDFTEDVEEREKIRELFENSKTVLAAPSCGLAPGLVSIIGNHLISKYDLPTNLIIACGALPVKEEANNFLKYKPTWSIDGLVNEYIKDCEIIKNYMKIKVPALSERYILRILEDEFEASLTSGGVGTLCDTFEGKIRELSYSSIRYPGHYELMKFLLNDLNLRKNNGNLLKKALKEKIPKTKKDFVVLYIETIGIVNGKLCRDVFVKKFDHKNDETALQRCTVYSMLGVLDLFLKGKTKRSGFLKQEEINYEDFMNSEYVREIFEK